jgi:hypothetical protein
VLGAVMADLPQVVREALAAPPPKRGR